MSAICCNATISDGVSLDLYNLLKYVNTAYSVARSGKVAQSSVFEEANHGLSGTPDKAIDGNRASAWSQNSCSHTLQETKPWWRLDLQTEYTVSAVTITFRNDCCKERINGAEIRVGNSLNDNGNGNYL